MEFVVKCGFEIVAVVEDLITLRSTAAVFVFVEVEVGKRFEGIALIEVPVSNDQVEELERLKEKE